MAISLRFILRLLSLVAAINALFKVQYAASEPTHESSHRDRAEIIMQRGSRLIEEGKYSDAVKMMNEEFAKQEHETGEAFVGKDAVLLLDLLGEALRKEGDTKRSEQAYRRAMFIGTKAWGDESPSLADSLHGLGMTLLSQGAKTEAVEALERALSIRRLKPGAETHFGSASRNLQDLATALLKTGSDGEEHLYMGALRATEIINRLSWRYFVAHLPWEGHGMLVKALEMASEEQAEEGMPLIMAAYHFNLGFLRLSVLGEYKPAVESFEEAQRTRSALLGGEHPLTIQAVVSLGWALTLSGETEQAVYGLTRSAKTLLAAEQPDAAERLLRQALEIAKAPLGPNTYAHACVEQHVNLLKSYGSKGLTQAEAFVRKQKGLSNTAKLGDDHAGVVLTKKLLSQALFQQVQEAEAIMENKGGSGKLLNLNAADIFQLQAEAESLA